MPMIRGGDELGLPARESGPSSRSAAEASAARRIQRVLMIARYLDGVALLEAAVRGISEAELDARAAHGWSAREIVHHLADAEMIASTRVRRLMAEEDAHFVAYDEVLWSRTAHYERPIDSALALVRAERTNTAELLRSLTDAEWEREGTHSIAGRYTPEVWLEYYAQHVHDHVAQVLKLRG